MRTSLRSFLLAVALGVAALAMVRPAAAVEPDEILPDAAMEQRARAISAELRCLVCQNQSIDDSNAPLARDLRLLVRERLRAGDSDAAVKSFVVARYGEFVLLRPQFGIHTAVLWLGPPLLLLATLVALMLWSRRMRQLANGPSQRLSDEEEARLAALLRTEDHTNADGERR
jgi:cytochrome c-type biogenesis protein CcmH